MGKEERESEREISILNGYAKEIRQSSKSLNQS